MTAWLIGVTNNEGGAMAQKVAKRPNPSKTVRKNASSRITRVARKQAIPPVTIAFAHLKGGVGKTTAAINVATCLARMRYKTLLVDMDPQSSASEVFLALSQPEKTLYHVLYEEVPVAQVIQPVSENLDLAPASINMAMLENRLRERVDGYHMLQIALENHPYEAIVIDTPPSIGVLTSNALIAATHLVIPVQASYFALKGIENIMQTYHTIRQRANPSLALLGVLITMIDDRLTFAKDIKADVMELFGEKLFNTVIHRTVRLEESPAYRKNIFEHAPRSRGSEEFLHLTQEIIDRCRNSSPRRS
jgi:chromosome partitioning protein